MAGAPPVAPPLYARILNSAWSDLPAEIRTMHEVETAVVATGRASVERGAGWPARLAAAVIGFPEAGDDMSVSVRFEAADGAETWTRTFGGKSFGSRQFAGSGRLTGLLCERFGALTFASALVLENRRLSLVLRHCSCCATGRRSAFHCRWSSVHARRRMSWWRRGVSASMSRSGIP